MLTLAESKVQRRDERRYVANVNVGFSDQPLQEATRVGPQRAPDPEQRDARGQPVALGHQEQAGVRAAASSRMFLRRKLDVSKNTIFNLFLRNFKLNKQIIFNSSFYLKFKIIKI